MQSNTDFFLILFNYSTPVMYCMLPILTLVLVGATYHDKPWHAWLPALVFITMALLHIVPALICTVLFASLVAKKANDVFMGTPVKKTSVSKWIR